MSVSVSRPKFFKRRPLWKLAALTLLLVIEIVLLTLRFEAAESLANSPFWWERIASHTHLIVPLAAGLGTALLLFSGVEIRRQVMLAASHARATKYFGVFVTAHILAMVLFAAITGMLFEGHVRQTGWPLAWVVAWIGCGALALGLWMLCLYPPGLLVIALKRSLRLLVPLSGLTLAAWGVAHRTTDLWEPMSRGTLWGVKFCLSAFYRDVICRPEELVIGAPNFVIHIAPACSGYQGIGLIWVFLSFYLWCFRRTFRFPRALLLLPIGTVIMWVVNFLRIAILVVVGQELSPEVAMGGFHSNAGWLLFCVVSLGIAYGARRVSFFLRDPARGEESTEGTEAGSAAAMTSAYLLPLLCVTSVTLFTGAFTHEFNPLYPLKVLVIIPIVWAFRRSYGELRSAGSWWAVGAGVFVFFLWVGLDPGQSTAMERAVLADNLTELPAFVAWGWLVFRFLGSVVVAPLTEELAFRGYLIRRMISVRVAQVPAGTFTWFSFVASSLLFGGLHGRWVAATVAGMIYALVWYRSGRLFDSVLAHACTNFLLMLYMLFTAA